MKKRVLVADDVPFNSLLLVEMLKRNGWECDQVPDGSEVISKLAGDHGYDLVFLDIKMPVMSGDEVCRVLRADSRYQSLPLIAYTAHALVEEQESLQAIGFDAILIKPISMNALHDAIQRAFDVRCADSNSELT